MSTIRLLIIDGQPLSRWALKKLADSQPDMTATVATVAEARSAVAAQLPTAVCVDLALDSEGGWELIRVLRAGRSDLGIVAVAPRQAERAVLRALDSGASAFVTRHSQVSEVLAAIRHAAAAPASFSAAGLGPAVRRRRESGTLLSPRETQVLHQLQAGHSIPAIANQLCVSPSTAKTYVARVYEKLGASNRAQALMAAFRLDLIDQDELSAV